MSEFDTLNECQKKVFVQVLDFLMDDNRNMFLLNGKAGTGKTYLTQFIVRALESIGAAVGVTATTHKAVRVLQSKIDGPVCTIHSLLNMGEKINPDGSISFVVKRMEGRPSDLVDIIIVDESSMIVDEIFHELRNLGNMKKIIFVGDENQIPPVGFQNSMPFNVQAAPYITRVSLDTIVRQAEGNPIIRMSGQLLNNMLFRGSVSDYVKAEDWQGGSGIAVMPMATVSNLCAKLFKSEAYQSDKNFVRVVAWTNEEVKRMSELVRKLIFPEVTEAITVGDLLTTNAPYDASMALDYSEDDDKAPRYGGVQNGSDLLIKEVELGTMRSEYGELVIYKIKAQVNGDESYEPEFPVLHEQSHSFYGKVCNELKYMAKNAKKEESGGYWKRYYAFKRCVLDCSYGYAVTGHKSQGSTYHNTIIMESNIRKNPNILEMNRIRYTAVTRSSHRVFIIV